MQTNVLDQQVRSIIKCCLLFSIKFKKDQRYITSLKGNKRKELTVSKRKTASLISVLRSCLFIRYLIIFLVKYVFYSFRIRQGFSPKL